VSGELKKEIAMNNLDVIVMNNLDVIVKLFFSFIFSFLFALYLVPLVKKIAVQLGIMDIPDGQIKKHKNPTPYLGGVAVYLAFIVAIALVFPSENHVFSFFVGITLLLFIGLLDDLAPLLYYQKFAGQMIAALCFLRAGFYLKAHFFCNYWAMPLSFLWILTMINAFNLVDVMDGLATTIAGCATLSFLIMALYLHQPIVAVLLSAFLGALVAFFWFNKPQARIYLGDSGSLFIGGFLATVPFMINWGEYNWYGYVTPLIVLALPALEVVTLVIVRTYKGIPFYLASPDHFSIYLQKKGWSRWKILGYMVFLALILFAGSFLFLVGVFPWGVVLAGGLLFLIAWFTVLLKK
jgi:UDP-GlcNAc:undecaprenyl-phosphate/decaprenyl-phosphate GlcNAc-1-phosphate transferase